MEISVGQWMRRILRDYVDQADVKAAQLRRLMRVSNRHKLKCRPMRRLGWRSGKKIDIRICVGLAHAKVDAWINFYKKIKYSVGQKPTHKEDEKKNIFGSSQFNL